MIYSFPDFIKQWLEKADHDLISAKVLIEHDPLILDNACFHCQQAVEKYLKAYLIYKEQETAKTHNIKYLIEQCNRFDTDFKKIDVKDIEIFAVKARYPDDSISPTLEEAKEYLQIASDVKALVLRKIQLK